MATFSSDKPHGDVAVAAPLTNSVVFFPFRNPLLEPEVVLVVLPFLRVLVHDPRRIERLVDVGVKPHWMPQRRVPVIARTGDPFVQSVAVVEGRGGGCRDFVRLVQQ